MDWMAGFSNGVYAVGFAGLYCGARFLWWGIEASREEAARAASGDDASLECEDRLKRADDARERRVPAARYLIAAVGLSMGTGVLLHLVAPSIAYALICLSLVVRSIADQVAEERAPRRRSALLGRSRRIDPILLIWIGLTAVLSLTLFPWIVNVASRAAAITVALCVVGSIFVALRIASAPPLLSGSDLEAEQIVDAETRANRTGNVCVLSVGAVMAFVFFFGLQSNVHVPDELFPIAWFGWVGLLAWKWLYARHLSHTPLTT